MTSAAHSSKALYEWLDDVADSLDDGRCDEESVLPQLVAAGVVRIGVDTRHGGSGGTVADAVEAIAAVANHSLTAAFVLWGQRAFVEYLLQSPNRVLRERLLPPLLAGGLAGATGLSNAMKYLSGLESLQVQAHRHGDVLQLDGSMPWVTNLRKCGFVVAAAISQGNAKPFVAAIPGDAAGLSRSQDLQLMGLQSSNTAALKLQDVQLGSDWILHDDAPVFLRNVRPAFLGLQCGLSIGLARRALTESRQLLDGARSVLEEECVALQQQLADDTLALKQGVVDQRFINQPAVLFRLRIDIAQTAIAAVQLELQARGGKAYLRQKDQGFARRWREAAFVPVVTPSLVQLRTELQRYASEAAA